MPKKTQRNGFYYFMLDFKKREEKKGNRFTSLKEVQESAKCSKEWQELPAEEKKRYNARAKKEKVSVEEKKTGLGESVKLLEKEENEIIRYETNMKAYIDSTIKHAINCNELDVTSFYFIHVNWYYTKIDMMNVVEYIPAEFSVIEFSLNDGVKRCYHEIIKAEIELGYAREAMEHADATHKIDICEKGPKTQYDILYNNFYDFLSRGDNSIKKLPPLYTSMKMKTVVPCFFQRMTDAVGAPKNTFDLYSLEYLFGTMMFELNDNFPETGNRASLAEAQLEKDAFVFTPNIECSYHSRFDGGGPFCSQSIVTQWAYALCDYFCPLVNVEMIKGKHCPNNYDSLVDGFNSLTVKEKKISIIRSETGVSEAYRLAVGGRTREENERRKHRSQPIEVIDYGEIALGKTPIIVPSASSSVYSSKVKHGKMRPPVSLSDVFDGFHIDETPLLDDKTFPSIGSSKSKSCPKK